MFKQCVSETPYYGEDAEILFPEIYGDTWGGDVSFVSTLRALLYPRLKEDEGIRLSFRHMRLRSSMSQNYLFDSIRSELSFESNSSGLLTVCDLECSDDGDYARYFEWIENWRSPFLEDGDGWSRISKITDFYRRAFRVVAFVSPERQSVILFTDKMTLNKLHYLQCAIVAFLPWYFDPKVGVSELEMELINSLREKTPDKYLSCLEKMAARYDMREQRIRRLMEGFEHRHERVEYERISRNIEELSGNIANHLDAIDNCLNEKSKLETKLLGLEAKLAGRNTEDSELMEYFLRNDHISVENVSAGGVLTFGCRGYLTYFDEEVAERMIRNRDGVIYKPDGYNLSRKIPADDMELLMRALFLDRRLKVRFCAAYSLNLIGGCEAVSSFTFGSAYRGYMPNPHIQHFRCVGNYARPITEAMQNHDYIGAIELCIASCMNLNFGDTPNIRCFMNIL